jgi:hypothetical protein
MAFLGASGSVVEEEKGVQLAWHEPHVGVGIEATGRAGDSDSDTPELGGGDGLHVARGEREQGVPWEWAMSYLVFMPKASTHCMHDLGSIVPHIRSKVFTDKKISRIEYIYYINSVPKDYDDS